MGSSPPPSKRRRKDEGVDDVSSPVVVLAHGAGAPSSSDWMIKSRLFSIFLFTIWFLYSQIIFFFK